MPSNFIKAATEQLKEIILESLGTCISDEKLPMQPISNFKVEIPDNKSFGDMATNVAMVCAKSFKMAPLQIAEIICENLSLEGTYFEKYNIVPPGFINFFLKSDWFADVLLGIDDDDKYYGKSNIGKDNKVMIEFVSANPTGPMHMGNARGGSLGDCLASILEHCGYDVTREFYINDAGNQIEKFGNSLEARYLQIFKGEENVPFPEDGYHGEDIMELAKIFVDKYGDKFVNEDETVRKKALVEFALPRNIEKMKSDLEQYRIKYDVWFKESKLHENKDIDKIIEILDNNNLTYKKDDALWYKASEFGSEKDEVLVRANGYPTYFAVDIAYHYNKFVDRKFDKVIDIWGADHHGHVARLKGAMNAVGLDSSKLDIILMQLVRLTKNGEVVRMSKRTGKSITLVDLLDEVPVDVARFFFNMREPNSHLDFDLDIAVEQSAQNPVYYVQYAHARICSIFKKITEEGSDNIKLTSEQIIDKILLQEEKDLIRLLALFPEEIEQSAKYYDPARITRYALEVATSFHKFYNVCKVNVEDKILMNVRMLICGCTKTVIKNALSVMKIDTPEYM